MGTTLAFDATGSATGQAAPLSSSALGPCGQRMPLKPAACDVLVASVGCTSEHVPTVVGTNSHPGPRQHGGVPDNLDQENGGGTLATHGRGACGALAHNQGWLPAAGL
jgi:hypothetical protein